MAINNRDRNNNTRQRTRTVFVPVGGGGSKIETEELSVSENGTYEAGKDKAYSKVTVKVTEPLGTVKIADGIKFAYSSFSELPEWVDFEGVTDMSKMFKSSGIQSIPLLNTSNVTNMERMFDSCYGLSTIPLLDTSNVSNMSGMFSDCSSLTTIPLIDTSQVTNMYGMFSYCSSLATIPQLDTSQVTTISNMFRGDGRLKLIPELNASNLIETGFYTFYQCTALTDFGGFVGLKCNLDLSPCTALTHDSIMNVINKAADVTASPKTLTLGSTNLAKLSDEEKGIATNKGWTLA